MPGGVGGATPRGVPLSRSMPQSGPARLRVGLSKMRAMNGPRTQGIAGILPFSSLLDLRVKMVNSFAVQAGARTRTDRGERGGSDDADESGPTGADCRMRAGAARRGAEADLAHGL